MVCTKKDYDVINTSLDNISDISKCVKPKQEMNGETPKIYRDENGALISESAISWEIAENKIKQGDLFFGRSLELAYNYKDAMTIVKRKWFSIDDYCKNKFLSYPSKSKTFEGRLLNYVDPSAKTVLSTALCKNDFPYYFEDGIEHYTLWTINAEINPVDYVETIYPKHKYDVIVFENLKINKSVKSVLHYHVLIKEHQNNHLGQFHAHL